MLRPLIFKNNDTETVKTKIGKVSSQLARMIYSFTLSGKVGILKDYGSECSIAQSVVGGLGKTTVTLNKGAVSIYGGIIYIEPNTTIEVPNVTNGSIGIYVDLSENAGKEAVFKAGENPPTDTDDLQANETTGKYYFELYKYSVSGSTFSTTSKTDKYIYSNKYLGDVIEGSQPVPKANQIVPSATTSNSVSFYIGEKLVKMEW